MCSVGVMDAGNDPRRVDLSHLTNQRLFSVLDSGYEKSAIPRGHSGAYRAPQRLWAGCQGQLI